jgi:hypothetical protein
MNQSINETKGEWWCVQGVRETKSKITAQLYYDGIYGVSKENIYLKIARSSFKIWENGNLISI